MNVKAKLIPKRAKNSRYNTYIEKKKKEEITPKKKKKKKDPLDKTSSRPTSILPTVS